MKVFVVHRHAKVKRSGKGKGKRITLTRRKTLAYTRSYTGWSRGDSRGLVNDEKDVSAEGAA